MYTHTHKELMKGHLKKFQFPKKKKRNYLKEDVKNRVNKLFFAAFAAWWLVET